MKRVIQFNPNLYKGCLLKLTKEAIDPRFTNESDAYYVNAGMSDALMMVERRVLGHVLGYTPMYISHLYDAKPILRTPDQMTSEEIQQFLTIINDAPTFDENTAPTANEISIVATNYFLKDEETETYFMIVFSTRCFEGTLMLNEYGGMFLVETGEMMSKGSTANLLPIFYQVQAIDYLRSIYVDCDALISNGLAIKQEDNPAKLIGMLDSLTDQVLPGNTSQGIQTTTLQINSGSPEAKEFMDLKNKKEP